MAKQPEFTKYLALEEWFRKQPRSAKQIELTFDQVEEISGSSFACLGDEVENLVDECKAQDPESSDDLAQQWVVGGGI